MCVMKETNGTNASENKGRWHLYAADIKVNW